MKNKHESAGSHLCVKNVKLRESDQRNVALKQNLFTNDQKKKGKNGQRNVATKTKMTRKRQRSGCPLHYTETCDVAHSVGLSTTKLGEAERANYLEPLIGGDIFHPRVSRMRVLLVFIIHTG